MKKKSLLYKIFKNLILGGAMCLGLGVLFAPTEMGILLYNIYAIFENLIYTIFYL